MNTAMEFDKRLERAIQRGQRVRTKQSSEARNRASTEDELRQLHTKLRIDLSEKIESCLRQVADHFPGFQYKTRVGEEGWGARISRDDVALRRRQADNVFSRLEMLITPFSSTHIVELVAKGTIRNKETVNRSHYQFLSEADVDSFTELIDLWVLEYAEQFAASH